MKDVEEEEDDDDDEEDWADPPEFKEQVSLTERLVS